MKMHKEHFEELKSLIEATGNCNPNVRQNYKEKGLSMMRYRWDLLWESKFYVNKLYEYLDDSQIDTALKVITKSIFRINLQLKIKGLRAEKQFSIKYVRLNKSHTLKNV